MFSLNMSVVLRGIKEEKCYIGDGSMEGCQVGRQKVRNFQAYDKGDKGGVFWDEISPLELPNSTVRILGFLGRVLNLLYE